MSDDAINNVAEELESVELEQDELVENEEILDEENLDETYGKKKVNAMKNHDDKEMEELFQPLDSRELALH